jgi:hypothetical protein
MSGCAFLSGLFYQALVIATVHRLKQAKTKSYQFSSGKRIIVFDAMDGVCLLIKLRKLVEVSSGLNMAGQAVTCPQEPDENG